MFVYDLPRPGSRPAGIFPPHPRLHMTALVAATRPKLRVCLFLTPLAAAGNLCGGGGAELSERLAGVAARKVDDNITAATVNGLENPSSSQSGGIFEK